MAAEDDIETRVITRATWLPPVKSRDELPTADVAEGSMCYVEGDVSGDEEVWEYRNSRWSRLDRATRTVEPGDGTTAPIEEPRPFALPGVHEARIAPQGPHAVGSRRERACDPDPRGRGCNADEPVPSVVSV